MNTHNSNDLVVAFSGGKDSTALALSLAERGKNFRLIHTSTGNELPDVRNHVESIATDTGAELIDLNAPSLEQLILEQQCLPNWRMRWCTRMIKIEPCANWLKQNHDVTLAVGLRADEQGRVGGTYEGAKIAYPLRDWGWGIEKVTGYVKSLGYNIPTRTDCAWCFYQTLSEWRSLWVNHPDLYFRGEQLEQQIGHTFRSPQRDAWPASLRDLRHEFENGRTPQKRVRKTMCRVCAL